MCEKCKKEIEKIEQVRQIKYKSKHYDEHIYMFKYTFIRDKILAYKFNDKAYYYKTFVRILLNNKKMCEILTSYDIIVPIPIHNKRRKERGYNQTELIAKEIAKNIDGLEYANILEKNKNTVPQSTLNKKDRIKNSVNVYNLKNISNTKINYKNIKNILIFDDIYTTGSTANECARILRKLEPKSIGILTIAKD